jgi:hypothetical protein
VPVDGATPTEMPMDGGMPPDMSMQPPASMDTMGMQTPMNPDMPMGGTSANTSGVQGGGAAGTPANGGVAGQIATPPVVMTGGSEDDGGCRVVSGSALGAFAPLAFALVLLGIRRRTRVRSRG